MPNVSELYRIDMERRQKFLKERAEDHPQFKTWLKEAKKKGYRTMKEEKT